MSDMARIEVQRGPLREHIADQLRGHRVNGTEVYDEMEDITEEPVEVTQVLPAPANMYAVMGVPGHYQATKVDYLISSEGTLWGYAGDREEVSPDHTLETLPGFQGYVTQEGADELSSGELMELLDETINKENN